MAAKAHVNMTPLLAAAATAVSGRAADQTAAPAWAVERVGAEAEVCDAGEADGDIVVRVADGGAYALTTARVLGAAALDAAALERRVTEAYAAIVGRIGRLGAATPVRLWNHIPSIHERMDGRRDRYMVFNAGRYRAFAGLYGGPEAFGREVATASGVGHRGDDLVVHCLSAREAGRAVENPRQIAPHRYSEKYGPLPPCFARATVLRGAGLILVGGTASIRGEDSLFPASLQLQMAETLTNLASVVEAAQGTASSSSSSTAPSKGGGDASRPSREAWLRRYRDVRVYFPRPADGEAIEAAARQAFGPACRVEMCRADLCRAELLVEIEGVAALEGCVSDARADGAT
jgi:hypothetical protein